MMEYIEDMFGDLNITAVMIALMAWLGSLYWIWKVADVSYMRIHVKIILTIIGAPLYYFIVNMMINK